MNNAPITCIVFDFDGTLSHLNIDFDAMKNCVGGLMARYGVDPRRFDCLYVLEAVAAASAALAAEGRGEEGTAFAGEAMRVIRDIEMDGARRGNLFEGVREMMSRLRRTGIKTGIITRNCLDAVVCVWPAVHSSCHALIAREAAAGVKPDPAHLRQMLALLAAPPEQSVMTGDHPIDMHVGKAAGTFTVGVLSGNATAQALREAGADLVIERAASIDECLTPAGLRQCAGVCS